MSYIYLVETGEYMYGASIQALCTDLVQASKIYYKTRNKHNLSGDDCDYISLIKYTTNTINYNAVILKQHGPYGKRI